MSQFHRKSHKFDVSEEASIPARVDRRKSTGVLVQTSSVHNQGNMPVAINKIRQGTRGAKGMSVDEQIRFNDLAPTS